MLSNTFLLVLNQEDYSRSDISVSKGGTIWPLNSNLAVFYRSLLHQHGCTLVHFQIWIIPSVKYFLDQMFLCFSKIGKIIYHSMEGKINPTIIFKYNLNRI